MELNERCIEILQYLIKQDDYVRTEELSNIYGLTDRTIRYDIDRIEMFLVKNGFKYLDRRHNKGVRLVKDKNLYKFVNSFINSQTPYRYAYSKDERFRYIAVKLLECDDPIGISYFENKLSISKSTVLKELDSIEKWLDQRNLKLIRKPRLGISVEGREADKRKAITEITSETISTGDIINYVNRKTAQSKISNLQFDILFSNIDVNYLDSLIRCAEKELGKEFSDESYGGLITHIALMIKRIQLNKNIYIPDISMESIRGSREYKVSRDMVGRIEKHFGINVPAEEIGYIALHLLGAKVIKADDAKGIIGYEPDGLYNVAETMVNEIERIYNTNFGDKKRKIIEGLVVHLRPTVYRIKFRLKLTNPIYDEIRMKYNELFLNTRLVVRHLEDYIGEKVDDQEVSYITLHFGAALENIKGHVKKVPRIILVCGTGIGTADMAASQLVNEFNIEVVDIISCREMGSIREKDYDFIISTVEIPDFDPKSYIRINPILMKNDYEKLKSRLQLRVNQNGDYYDRLMTVSKLIDIVEKYCNVQDRQQLQYEFMYELSKRNDDIWERRHIYMLNELLNRDTIKLNCECSDWVEAIKTGTGLLISKGFVEYAYEEAILNNFRQLGPYMVVAPGIVFSHARPENGVRKLSMSLITLKNPVNFGNELNDPVKLVITLAAVDNDSHLKALAQLMKLFMNTEDIVSIFKASNKEDVVQIINKYSR